MAGLARGSRDPNGSPDRSDHTDHADHADHWDHGDYTGFAAFVTSRERGLLRAAYLVCGDVTEAEDIVQGALVKLAARLERIRDEHPDAYIRQIVYRDAVSWWRRRRAERGAIERWIGLRQGVETRSRVAAPDGGAGYAVARVDVARALGALTPKQRAVVVLRFFEDRSERDVAEILGVTVGTVKSQTHAALGRLRAALPPSDEPSGIDDTTLEGEWR